MGHEPTYALQQDALVFDTALEAMAADSVHDRHFKLCQANDREAVANLLTNLAPDPFVKIPEFKFLRRAHEASGN